MFSIMQSEWLKFRRTNMLPIIFAGPFIAIANGLLMDYEGMGATGSGFNIWYLAVIMMNLTYGLLLLPLITGVLAGSVTRYEHQAGGWKQLLALPVTRGNVFIVKFIFIVLLVFFIQLLYLGAIYLVGTMKGFSDPFPIDIIWKSIIGGWIATFPIVALQLWLSIAFKSFAAPFAVNVIFTLPTILAANSEKFGPYYPWAQPFLMMNIGGDTGEVFFVPWEQVMSIVGGSFIVFFLVGYIYFQRKAV